MSIICPFSLTGTLIQCLEGQQPLCDKKGKCLGLRMAKQEDRISWTPNGLIKLPRQPVLFPLVQLYEKNEPPTCLSHWFRVFYCSPPNTILPEIQVMHFRPVCLCACDSPCLKCQTLSFLLVNTYFSVHLKSLQTSLSPSVVSQAALSSVFPHYVWRPFLLNVTPHPPHPT